jgi:ABC-type phosphate/phosphonate transport system ATPase subunit
MSSVAIVGKSGTGKSTSYGQFPQLNIKGLNPKETVIINVSGKDLPFRGWKKLYTGKLSEKGNYLQTSNIGETLDKLKDVSKNQKHINQLIRNLLDKFVNKVK